MLSVQLLEAGAKAPVCSRPGQDLGYDVFALEDTMVYVGEVVKVRTGVAVEVNLGNEVVGDIPGGLIVKDRSSMAAKGVLTHGGVIDAGYRGEVGILMSFLGDRSGEEMSYLIREGDKIAQLVPVLPLTRETVIVNELTPASRGEKGFGSSGR